MFKKLFNDFKNNYYFVAYFPLVFVGLYELIMFLKKHQNIGDPISLIVGMYPVIICILYIFESVKDHNSNGLSKISLVLIMRTFSLIVISFFVYSSLRNMNMSFAKISFSYIYMCLFISWYISIFVKKIKNMKTNELISFLALVVGAFATIIAALLK